VKVAIIGKGNVGTAVARGLNGKHEIKFGHRDPNEPVLEAAKWGEIIIIAVPYSAVDATVKELGASADGKPVVDVTNALTSSGDLAVGFSTSAAEELQKKLPKAFVFKAFNTVFAQNQSTGKIGKDQLTLLVASNSAETKQIVMQLGSEVGFEPVDAGGLKAARYLEPMKMLIISLAFGQGMEQALAISLLKAEICSLSLLLLLYHYSHIPLKQMEPENITVLQKYNSPATACKTLFLS
jgi:8-hydroxy-5-deazaflavin:NADPH oxidoreductase